MLGVAVLLGPDERGLELFGDAVSALAVGDIVFAPTKDGLVLLSFEVARDPAVYLRLIGILAAYNRYVRLTVDDDAACIYEGLLRYEENNITVCLGGACRERETFQSNVALFARGAGDCADLVAARCAEPDVLEAGGAPRLFLVGERPTGGRAYHAVIQYPNGRTEDPSAALGMGM